MPGGRGRGRTPPADPGDPGGGGGSSWRRTPRCTARCVTRTGRPTASTSRWPESARSGTSRPAAWPAGRWPPTPCPRRRAGTCSAHGVPRRPVRAGHVPAVDRFGRDVDVIALSRSHDHPALRRMAVFDAVVNNADRKIGHLLPDGDGHLFGCDHGVCFTEDYKLRTVLWQWRGRKPTDQAVEALARLQQLADRGSRHRAGPACCAGRGRVPLGSGSSCFSSTGSTRSRRKTGPPPPATPA